MVGATGRGRVAGNRPIGMRYERGVVGKHPIGIPGVACRKHGVCARVGVGAGASTMGFNLHSLRSIKKDRTYRKMARGGYSLLAATQPKYYIMQAAR